MHTQTLVPALPLLPVAELLPSFAPARPAVYPLDRVTAGESPRARLYYLARNGVYHGLRAMGIGAGDVVLMPAYHHGVEVEAVRASGAEVVFYRVDERGRADLDDAARRAGDARHSGRVKALYLTHLAGWPQPTADAASLCRRRGWRLVEDCALSLFCRDEAGRPLGSTGDLAIFCLYKTLPVPHGGIAVVRGDLTLPAGRPPSAYSTLHHLAGAALTRLTVSGGPPMMAVAEWLRAAKRRTLGRVARHTQVGTQHLAPAELELGASPVVPRLLERVDATSVVVRRRRNYQRMLAALDGLGREPFGPLPDGTSPLFLPLALPRGAARKPTLEALWSRGIEAVDFWSFGDPGATAQEFPEAAALRRDVIELPIHQDLDDEAVDRVAYAVKDVLAHV